MAEEGQAASKTLLAALATGFVHAALDARHGFTHFAHSREGGAIFTTGKTKTTLVNRGFARFGCHGIPYARRQPCWSGQVDYFNRLWAVSPGCSAKFQGSKAKACKYGAWRINSFQSGAGIVGNKARLRASLAADKRHSPAFSACFKPSSNWSTASPPPSLSAVLWLQSSTKSQPAFNASTAASV